MYSASIHCTRTVYIVHSIETMYNPVPWEYEKLETVRSGWAVNLRFVDVFVREFPLAQLDCVVNRIYVTGGLYLSTM